MNKLHDDKLEDEWARRVTTRLSESAKNLPHDISERLRTARMRAVEKRSVVRFQVVVAVKASGAAGVVSLRGGEGDAGADKSSFWYQLAVLLPMFFLVIGLLVIARTAEDNHVDEVAEIDAELLTDELPLAAYIDPGFTQFLYSRHIKENY